MQTLIAAAARHPVFSNLLMVVILLSGLYGYTNLRRESMPSLNLDMISVSVAYPGAAASEVEEGILVKLENALKGLRGVKYIEGQAVESFGSVTIYLKDKVKDKQKILEEVKSSVAQISTFPKDAEPPQVKEIIFTSEAFLLILHGNAPERVLHELGYDIKEEIMELGISQVSLSGVRNYEIDRCSVYFPTADLPAAEIIMRLQQEDIHSYVMLVISLEPNQQAALRPYGENRTTRWVVPNSKELTTLLLSPKPIEVFVPMLANQ